LTPLGSGRPPDGRVCATLLIITIILLAGCRSLPERRVEERRGEELVVAGRFFPAGTRVVTWLDVSGYNLYQSPPGAPQNHEPRRALAGVTSRRGEWKRIQAVVDQLVLHYDNAGLSSLTFGILQRRGLSAHFLVDVDGTIYQTLDLRERAWHATTSNERSIGVEIANIGAYPPAETKALADWHVRDPDGRVRLRIPPGVREPRLLNPGFVGRPDRNEPVHATIQNRDLVQYDFTPEQYAALGRLAAALNRVFPKIRLEVPRDANGAVQTRKLDDKTYESFTGILGHFHIQDNKVDPGPAFQWEKLILHARQIREPKD
jgi:N-acetyl-anhydromuramyl-L-alanine amidase AmpD